MAAALAACVQAGHLREEEQVKYLFFWRRLLSYDSREQEAAALRALAASGHHEATTALVRATVARVPRELPPA